MKFKRSVAHFAEAKYVDRIARTAMMDMQGMIVVMIAAVAPIRKRMFHVIFAEGADSIFGALHVIKI